MLTWPPNIPDLIPIEHLWDLLEKTDPIHGRPTSQIAGLKGSATDSFVPVTIAYFQRSIEVHTSTGYGGLSYNVKADQGIPHPLSYTIEKQLICI